MGKDSEKTKPSKPLVTDNTGTLETRGNSTKPQTKDKPEKK